MPGGDTLLGFQRLLVDFELSSIWHRAYTFASIDIGAPSINAIVAHDGSLNLLQLKPKVPPPPKPEEKNQPLPAIRIGSLKVSDGLLSYEDRSRPADFAARLQPINFELRDFTTGVHGGQFTFSGTSKLGERIEWHGHLSAQPVESDGEFRLVGLQAHTIWEYIEDRVGFEINSGSIDVDATYKFALRDAVDLKLDVSKVAVSDLAVRPKQSDSDWITVPQLLVSGTSFDLLKRQAHVESVSLSGLKVVTWLEPDGSVNLLKLAAAPPAPPPPTPAPRPRSPCGSREAGGRLRRAVAVRAGQIRFAGCAHIRRGPQYDAGREGAAGAAVAASRGSEPGSGAAAERIARHQDQRQGISESSTAMSRPSRWRSI